jgi:hypothetical protein
MGATSATGRGASSRRPQAPRSDPLSVLDLPLPFQQANLLTVDGFAREARRRGVHLDAARLEALHRGDVLVPLFRMARDIREARTAARRQGGSASDYLIYTPTAGDDLKRVRQGGALFDPRQEPPRPWSRYRREVDSFPVRTSEFLYSRYQLLGLDTLHWVLSRFRPHRLPGEPPRWRYRLTMRDFDWIGVSRPSVQELILLAAIEARYLPGVTGIVAIPRRGQRTYEEYEREFDPRRVLRWLGWKPDAVFNLGRGLLARARHLDPMPQWLPLVRNAWPRSWNRFEGAALGAMDNRIAGEMVLRFYEDAVARPSPEFEEMSEQRLRAEPAELDEALTEHGLSPHPLVIVALEGATEMTLAPLVAGHLGLRWHPRIRFLDAEGVGSNLAALAAYAVTPGLGQEFPRGVLLTRPPTHLMVIRDAEGKSRSPEDREKIRKRWIDRVMRGLPDEFQNPATREQIEPLVKVETWTGGAGRRVFEFAHFTDRQLAMAITAVHRDRGGSGQVEARHVRKIRSTSQRIDEAWKGLRPRPSKPEIALELWPVLQRRIDRAIDANRLESIPLARIVVEAAQRARRPSGRVALIRGEPE